MSRYIHEMRAYGKKVGDETSYDVVGFIVLDEDNDEPIRNIYEDERITTSCGSNWSLVDTGVTPKETIAGSTYYHGDWRDYAE